jgi:hypothetical protein
LSGQAIWWATEGSSRSSKGKDTLLSNYEGK